MRKSTRRIENAMTFLGCKIRAKKSALYYFIWRFVIKGADRSIIRNNYSVALLINIYLRAKRQKI